MREITCVAVDLTTHCDRRCPDCCCGIGINRKLAHHSWDYLEQAARNIGLVERIHITGGEPTAHPRFAEFAPRLKALFGCETLTMQTDCYRTTEYAAVLEHFDHVYVSIYDEGNRKAARLVQLNRPSTAWSGAFTPRSRRGSGNPCARGTSETVAYADGQFFGCCVAPGIDGTRGMTPTVDWRERIIQEPLPCKECFFSV